MIDGWFSVLVVCFISAIGGLSALLIQGCLAEHGEMPPRSEQPYPVAASTTDDSSMLGTQKRSLRHGF
jgi:hypothetical protein